jgi:hypothetical protein
MKGVGFEADGAARRPYQINQDRLDFISLFVRLWA